MGLKIVEGNTSVKNQPIRPLTMMRLDGSRQQELFKVIETAHCNKLVISS